MVKYSYGQPPRQRRRGLRVWAALGVLLAVFMLLKLTVFGGSNEFPKLEGTSSLPVSAKSEAVATAWPNYGQAAVGARGFGVLDSVRSEKPQPTASVAKVMTALAIVEKKPLKLKESGPTLTMTQRDVDSFGFYLAKNGTVVKVEKGQKITQYQALQYMMIPSANNMADTLARWGFGSMDEYTKYANERAKELGMTNSHFADASGYSPETVSTAADLVKLGEAAMKYPVLREIVRTWEITTPSGHKAQNSNVFLDYQGNGVIGIKTGDTDQAHGVYLFAAEHVVEGKAVVIIGAVMGAKTLHLAQEDAMKILAAAKSGFTKVELIKAGQEIGYYETTWQGRVKVVAGKSLESLVWRGKPLEPRLVLDPIVTPLPVNSQVGTVEFRLGARTLTVPAQLQSQITLPEAGRQ